MQLAIDAGNSSIKYGLFENNELLINGKLLKGQSLKNFIPEEKFNKINTTISCSVLNELKISDLPHENHILINQDSIFPFPISYESPETMGIDRVVASVGAYSNEFDTLVIDAGSCITYDFVSRDQGYMGGAISPGIEMRFRSMNNFTDKLPLISQFKNHVEILGTTTNLCMQSGTINGIIHEIKGFIKYFKSKSTNLKVFLTGGDSIFLGTELKSGIFVDQNLVLKGLNSLIKLNEA
ncbi:MAG: pantothenate kinase [Flavobacteriales bacterium]|nr:pantothenate kinase [Flavobacteriales bacterium]MBO73350.1 pantothenate kinase [Flavobacteriales bacterium]|tara:strand:- start:19314 stop:20027 length:714 start_codon:yes stop_codon:yes gene_type:complete